MPNETTGERLLAHRYRLVTQVGRGGMGTVWQAHDEVLGRDVAVKEVILPHGLTDEERTVHHKRTFREARTAARLGHPGVVTVYDVVEEDGRPWIIMELIQARSLDQVIKQEGPIEQRRAAEIGRQMLAALHAAHEAGVLHRDVKPSNVLVTRGDRAVLTDFGIATAAGDATLTQTGLVMGSPAYIAPERARGRTAGPASDLWSLGVTLFAMTHGKSPFERSEPMAALVAVISEDPDPPDNAGRLAPVIRGLLRKDPDRRMDAIEAGVLLDDLVRQESIDTQRTMAVEVPAQQPPEQQTHRQAPGPADATLQDEAFPPADLTRSEEPASAMAWRTGPPTEAGSDLRERQPGSRNVLVIGLIVLVILAAIALFVLTMDDDQTPVRTQGTTTSPSATQRSTTAAPTSTRTNASAGLPANFRLHRDPSGFTIAIPKDWKGPIRRGSSRSSVFFDAPSGGGYIQVDQAEDPNDSALEDWRKYEPSARGSFPGYRREKIAPVTEGEPVSDPSGEEAADWEWTYDGRSGRMHALNRGFIMNDTGYAIVLVAPDADWDRTFQEMAPVYQFFEPKDED